MTFSHVARIWLQKARESNNDNISKLRNPAATHDEEIMPSVEIVLLTCELADAILGQCDFKDLLRVQATSRLFRYVITTSTILRRKLHLTAAPAALSLLPITPRTIAIDIPLMKVGGKHKSLLCLKILRPYTHGQRIHPSYADMSILQPPVPRMSVRFGCDKHVALEALELQAEDGNGITLGQMMQAAQSQLEQHCEFRCDLYKGIRTVSYFEVLDRDGRSDDHGLYEGEED